MSKVKTIIPIVLIALILCGVAVSQSRSRSKARTVRAVPAPAATPLPIKRPVTINLKQGDPIRGFFLRADANTVQVEVKSGSMAVKLNEIDSLQFAPEESAAVVTKAEAPVEAAPVAQDTVTPNARKAFTALRKLADAAKIGLPYPQYTNLLIEVRPAVDQALGALPEGAIKSDVAAAMEAYTDAGQAWSAMTGTGILPIATEPGATLMKKYAIKPAVNALGQEDRLLIDTTLSTIWTAAGTRLNNIATILK
jgi:hypothetical protein